MTKLGVVKVSFLFLGVVEGAGIALKDDICALSPPSTFVLLCYIFPDLLSNLNTGKSDNRSLKGNHDAEQRLSIPSVALSESRVGDGSSSLNMNNKTTGKGTVLSHGQKGEGGGGVVGIVEKTNTDVRKDMHIGNASLYQQGIFQGEKDRGTKEWEGERMRSIMRSIIPKHHA